MKTEFSEESEEGSRLDDFENGVDAQNKQEYDAAIQFFQVSNFIWNNIYVSR